MSYINLAKSRYSCRAYKDIPVEKEKLENIARTALLSPSACNSQPWSFVVVHERELAKKVAKTLQDKILPINKFTSECNSFIVIVEEPANLSAKLGGKFKDQQFAQMDIGIVAYSISLAATDASLGSCIIGWFDEKKLSDILKIPDSKRIRLVISIGYPESDSIPEKTRKSPNEKIHYNEWGNK